MFTRVLSELYSRQKVQNSSRLSNDRDLGQFWSLGKKAKLVARLNVNRPGTNFFETQAQIQRVTWVATSETKFCSIQKLWNLDSRQTAVDFVIFRLEKPYHAKLSFVWSKERFSNITTTMCSTFPTQLSSETSKALFLLKLVRPARAAYRHQHEQ